MPLPEALALVRARTATQQAGRWRAKVGFAVQFKLEGSDLQRVTVAPDGVAVFPRLSPRGGGHRACCIRRACTHWSRAGHRVARRQLFRYDAWRLARIFPALEALKGFTPSASPGAGSSASLTYSSRRRYVRKLQSLPFAIGLSAM